MASIEEVKAALAQATDEAGRGITGIRGVTDSIDRAIARLRATAGSSSGARISQSIAQLEAAKAKLAEATQLASAGIHTAREYSSIL